VRCTLVTLALALACGGEDEKKPAAKRARTARPVRVIDAAPPDPVAPLPGARDEEEALPAVTAASPSPEAASRARRHHAEALALRRDGRLEEAIERFRDAVAADPSLLAARYDLATAHAAGDDQVRAFAVLAQLRDPACAGCPELLARARHDSDWKQLWADAEFIKVTTSPVGPTATVLLVGFGDPVGDERGVRTFAVLEPAAGWARAPAIDVEVSSGGKPIAKRSWKPEEVGARSIAFEPPPGTVTAVWTIDGVPVKLRARPQELQPDSYPYQVRKKKPPADKVARCAGLECPSFPAMSADGGFLVTRDRRELLSPGARCNPPTATLTEHVRIGPKALEPVGSRDLTGYEPLTCGDKATGAAGFTVESDEEQEAVVVLDPAGQQVAKRTELIGVSVEVCASPAHRFAIIRVKEAVGGDCDEVGDVSYSLLRY
jgi:hypothetical protein